MYAGNTYLVISAIGLVITVIAYEPLGQMGYDYFRGQDTSRKGATVEPVQDQREGDESQGSRVGEAGDRLLLGDADEDNRSRHKSEKERAVTTKEAPRSSVVFTGTVVDDLRKSLEHFNKKVSRAYEERRIHTPPELSSRRHTHHCLSLGASHPTLTSLPFSHRPGKRGTKYTRSHHQPRQQRRKRTNKRRAGLSTLAASLVLRGPL